MHAFTHRELGRNCACPSICIYVSIYLTTTNFCSGSITDFYAYFFIYFAISSKNPLYSNNERHLSEDTEAKRVKKGPAI